MTDQNHAEQFAAFVNALGPEGHYSDLEPEGVASVRDADGNLHELRRDTLRAMLAERDQLAEKLAAATRTVATVAGQRDELAAAIDRTTGQMHHYRDAGLSDVNIRQVINLLSPTCPDGNYASPPPDGPQPHQDAPAASSAIGEPSNASSNPQRGPGDVPTDYTRYLPGNDSAGRLALWCTDCVPDGTMGDLTIWTEDDPAEQLTELCLANLIAITDQHEHEHHHEDNEPDTEAAPHVVAVTHLPGGFDLNDRKPHEQLIGNGVAGWVSHQVQHPPACHQLPYGQPCTFDDEWENGHYTYDDIEPGLYHVQARAHDVGDHNGEYSHTEDYLDYQRVGDAPQRTVAEPGPGYSSEAPF